MPDVSTDEKREAGYGDCVERRLFGPGIEAPDPIAVEHLENAVVEQKVAILSRKRTMKLALER
jgi:hypothetical protein